MKVCVNINFEHLLSLELKANVMIIYIKLLNNEIIIYTKLLKMI